jgi:SAM-dependent methyltransferase
MDLADRLLGQRVEMMPARSEIFVGSVEGFKKSGETLVGRLVGLGDLRPDSKVLDIGCGIGRLAVPLTHYLSSAGSYDGLDVVPSGIEWCNANIAARHDNFHFTLADVFNREYNPKGRAAPAQYRFPYGDDTFDLIVLVSVFTHMLPPDMERYVQEIWRVLKPGGRCFATYFLINAESRQLMESGESSLRFNHDLGSYWLVTRKVPELSVGYDETYVREVFKRCGTFTDRSIYYGGWCGRPPSWSDASGLGDQDIVLATK